MNRLRQIFNFINNMGWRYILFRILFTARKKIGLLKRNFPVEVAPEHFISLADWKNQEAGFFFKSKEDLEMPLNASAGLKDKAEAILEGKIPFFNAIEFDLGVNYDWVTNPDTGYRYDLTAHWSEVNDYSAEAGDIKYVWEKSRFNYIYTIIRYDYHFKKDLSAFVLNEISDWIDSNPINRGPNYKCSQEISLRVFNWSFAINYYKHSPALTETVFQKIIHSIYWQVRHIYSNINFSRIAVRNNHAITETLGLYLFGLLFPFYPEAGLWKKNGKKWFQEEIAYQIYSDGTFLQFSMNYHRVVVQLFCCAFSITESAGEKFDSIVYDRAYASLKFLYACQDEATGWLPNYGSNDGALFFPLSSCDYRDYRPQLNTLHLLLSGKQLYASGALTEDAQWFNARSISAAHYPPLSVKQGWHTFNTGGYAILRENDTITFIRCGRHKDRPAQADNLHIDIWHKGKNILYDGGSYKYNSSPELSKYFMGTASHNSVMLNGLDQMQKGSRFIWYYWSQAIGFSVKETAQAFEFKGAINAFRYTGKGIVHQRTVRKDKQSLQWTVTDEISGKPANWQVEQVWHFSPNSFSVHSKDENDLVIPTVSCAGWVSNYYGLKEPITFIKVKSDSSIIETTLSI